MKKTASSRSTASKAPAPEKEPAKPGFRDLIFTKNCTNAHGSFVKGDHARGAFSRELVDSYLKAGILVRRGD